jgi:uncharacterized protein (DUF433 family)
MPDIAERIEVDVNRCHGKPVIKGTRVMVRTILGALAAGDSVERIAQAYDITIDDVRAAVRPCDSRGNSVFECGYEQDVVVPRSAQLALDLRHVVCIL